MTMATWRGTRFAVDSESFTHRARYCSAWPPPPVRCRRALDGAGEPDGRAAAVEPAASAARAPRWTPAASRCASRTDLAGDPAGRRGGVRRRRRASSSAAATARSPRWPPRPPRADGAVGVVPTGDGQRLRPPSRASTCAGRSTRSGCSRRGRPGLAATWGGRRPPTGRPRGSRPSRTRGSTPRRTGGRTGCAGRARHRRCTCSAMLRTLATYRPVRVRGRRRRRDAHAARAWLVAVGEQPLLRGRDDDRPRAPRSTTASLDVCLVGPVGPRPSSSPGSRGCSGARTPDGRPGRDLAGARSWSCAPRHGGRVGVWASGERVGPLPAPLDRGAGGAVRVLVPAGAPVTGRVDRGLHARPGGGRARCRTRRRCRASAAPSCWSARRGP